MSVPINCILCKSSKRYHNNSYRVNNIINPTNPISDNLCELCGSTEEERQEKAKNILQNARKYMFDIDI